MPLLRIDQNVGEGITLLTLNRPEKRNALNLELMQLLCEAIDQANKDPEKRVLIITGEGPLFCAGMDLKESLVSENIEPIAQMIAKLLLLLYSSPLITVAAVHGAAIAGGAGLMIACDFIIASTEIKIGFPEVQRGLVPALVATLLCQQLKERLVRELLLFGRWLDAKDALDVGLINQIASSENLLANALAFARLAQEGAPKAISETKRLIAALQARSLSEGLHTAYGFHHQARASSEAQEGIAAFFENRKPSWVKE